MHIKDVTTSAIREQMKIRGTHTKRLYVLSPLFTCLAVSAFVIMNSHQIACFIIIIR